MKRAVHTVQYPRGMFTSGGLIHKRRFALRIRVFNAHSSTPQDDHNSKRAPFKPATAADTLRLLQKAQEESARALQTLPAAMMPPVNSPGAVDVRMYEQVCAARNRLSKKLSEANAYSSYLERRLENTTDQLIAAMHLINQINMEFGTTARIAEGAIAAAQFGVDGADALLKLDRLMTRLSLLEEAVTKQREELQKGVPRKVAVAWSGLASEVRVMGDFDGWTQGLELSADDVGHDNVITTFTAELPLLPGTYRIKFRVDGEWRLANDWPTETTPEGDTNNVLIVS